MSKRRPTLKGRPTPRASTVITGQIEQDIQRLLARCALRAVIAKRQGSTRRTRRGLNHER